MWSTPPPPPPGSKPKKKGSPWVPIAAAVGVFVLVLGALGVWFLVKPEDSPPIADPPNRETSTTETTDTTTRTTREAPPAVDPDSFDGKLLAMLPSGFNEGVCQPVHPPVMGALATVECGPGAPQGSPTSSRYSLFADQPALDKAFDDTSAMITEMMQCPGSGTDSPTTWNYTDTPDQIEGRVACGTYNSIPDVVWTKNADLVLGDSLGEDLETLHNWWLKFG